MQDDHCDCKKFGATCMVMTEVPEGTVVVIDETCDTLQYFQDMGERFLTSKHKLRKGGDKTCGDLSSGHSS